MIDLTMVIQIALFTYQILLIVTVIYLLLDNREPASAISWILVFFLLPYIGFVLYYFLGRNLRKSTARKPLINQIDDHTSPGPIQRMLTQEKDEIRALAEAQISSNKKRLIQFLNDSCNSILTHQNEVVIFHSGQEKFDSLIQDLTAAQHSIHMEYFIWRSDALSQKIETILIEKAKSGVQVRVLIDYLGSFFFSAARRRALVAAGVKVFPFFNFLSWMKLHTLNHRNHRKLVIIDGRISYFGGMNLGQEYIDGGRWFSGWRDVHVKVTGPTSTLNQMIFAVDWFNTTNERLVAPDYFPEVAGVEGNVAIQVITAGPDSKWQSVHQSYFLLITEAEESIYIQSPYFIPDQSIVMAIKTCALKGVDVRLMITGVPDKRLPFWAAFTYFKDLLRAGVKIYLYQKGFLHAKTVCVDSEICSIGTANMDIRSFKLNYEHNAIIYDRQLTKNMEQAFLADLEDCVEVTLDDYRQIAIPKKMLQSLARLLSPLF